MSVTSIHYPILVSLLSINEFFPGSKFNFPTMANKIGEDDLKILIGRHRLRKRETTLLLLFH